MAKRSKLTKKKSEKAWTNGKRKFKAHDPVYRNLDVRQQMAHHAKKKERCMAPKGDKDANDIPPIFGSMFGGGKDLFGSSAGPPKATTETPKKTNLSKKARRRAQAKEAENSGDMKRREDAARPKNFDISHATLPKEVQPALPKQRELETLGDYNRRLQQAVKEKLQAVQKKANTDHQRERQKERAKVAKEKRRAKKKIVPAPTEAEAEMERKKPKFGEVVQRPPSFTKDSLKSLKTAKTSSSAPLAAANLSDYASKVRDAYEEMKKKRREKASTTAQK